MSSVIVGMNFRKKMRVPEVWWNYEQKKSCYGRTVICPEKNDKKSIKAKGRSFDSCLQKYSTNTITFDPFQRIYNFSVLSMLS